MKVVFKTILFAVIVCMFAMLVIGCNNKNQNNEQMTKSTEVEVDNADKSVNPTEQTEKKQEEAQKESTSEKVENAEKEDYNSKPNTNVESKPNSNPNSNVDSNPNVDSSLINLGEFRLTAYCNCSRCCGQWAGGATASGVMPVANHTIAVDTSVIPFGTKVVINGNTYVAEDTGSSIIGNRIDIYFNSHQEALNFGVQYANVYKVVD